MRQEYKAQTSIQIQETWNDLMNKLIIKWRSEKLHEDFLNNLVIQSDNFSEDGQEREIKMYENDCLDFFLWSKLYHDKRNQKYSKTQLLLILSLLKSG